RKLPGHNGFTVDAVFSPDGQMIATGGADGVVRIWDLTIPTQPRETVLSGPFIADISFHPDGSLLALANGKNTAKGGRNDFTLRLWDVNSQQITKAMTGHTDWLTSVEFHPDGRSLASGSLDKTVRLWNSDTGELQTTFVGHDDAVTSVAFASDEVVSASRDGTVRVWSASDGKQRLCFSHQGQPVVALAARADGLIVSATESGTLWFWESTHGTSRGQIKTNCKGLACLEFSPDGKTLAMGSEHPEIHVWNIDSTLMRINESSVIDSQFHQHLIGHTGPVTGMSFSSDGKRLVSTSDDRFVKCWDVAMGQEIFGFAGGVNLDTKVAFCPDGIGLFHTGYSTITRWQATSTAMSREQPEEVTKRNVAWHTKGWQRAVDGRNWHAAIFHRSHLSALEPDEPRHLAFRGVAYAELGRWDEAAADWEVCIERSDSPGDVAEMYFRLALMNALRRDMIGYRQSCQEMWESFRDSQDHHVANILAWTCCLVSDSGISSAECVTLARHCVEVGKFRGSRNTCGGCLYRDHQVDEAIKMLHASMEEQGNGGWPQDWAFLAICHLEKGEREAAIEYLTRATAWLQNQGRRAEGSEQVDSS
ncbi:MAG: hypothetical protein KDB27_30225, partial [Planctomycetales bacterium]|nr:hypothetical protein [Planctomycetales bacterium]